MFVAINILNGFFLWDLFGKIHYRVENGKCFVGVMIRTMGILLVVI